MQVPLPAAPFPPRRCGGSAGGSPRVALAVTLWGYGPSLWGRTIPHPLLCLLPPAPGYFEVQGLSLVGPQGPSCHYCSLPGGTNEQLGCRTQTAPQGFQVWAASLHVGQEPVPCTLLLPSVSHVGFRAAEGELRSMPTSVCPLCWFLGVESSQEPRLRGHSHRASWGGSCPQPACFQCGL